MAFKTGSSEQAAIVMTGASVDFLEVAIVIAVGVLIWALATFLIRKVTKRIAQGITFLKKERFRWVAPA
ncbi:MAG: hypothetical protein J7474_12200, partial [Arthrobacter sp.]|nr:hypothetical protein [Arthrobacter sp.]